MTRARIVIAAVGSLGDLFPFLAIGAVLRERGHRVDIASHGLHAAQVAAAGLGFVELDAIALPADPAAFFADLFHPLRGPQRVVRDVAAANVGSGYAALAGCGDIDLLLTSNLAFAGPLLAETRGLRWASAVLSPGVFFSASDPPATGIGAVDASLRAWPALARLLRASARRIAHDWTAPLRAFRTRLGLPAVGALGDPLFEGQHAPACVLALFPALLGMPQPDWPPQAAQTGFARHRPPLAELPADLAAFLDAGPPPLVFSLGSALAHAGAAFYRDSLAASQHLGRRAVLLTGAGGGAAALPDRLPESARVIDYLPHAQLFPRAAAVIHHGGIGTSLEALRSGRPMLVVPHAFDQPDNAARLRRLGVAAVLPARRYTAARASAALHRLLADPRPASTAAACAPRVADDGAARAADALEALLQA